VPQASSSAPAGLASLLRRHRGAHDAVAQSPGPRPGSQGRGEQQERGWRRAGAPPSPRRPAHTYSRRRTARGSAVRVATAPKHLHEALGEETPQSRPLRTRPTCPPPLAAPQPKPRRAALSAGVAHQSVPVHQRRQAACRAELRSSALCAPRRRRRLPQAATSAWHSAVWAPPVRAKHREAFATAERARAAAGGAGTGGGAVDTSRCRQLTEGAGRRTADTSTCSWPYRRSRTHLYSYYNAIDCSLHCGEVRNTLCRRSTHPNEGVKGGITSLDGERSL